MSNFAILDSLYPYQTAQGACRQSNYTATTIKTKDWYWVTEQDGLQIQGALNTQPVGVAINADTNEFNYYSSGVFSCSALICNN